MSRQQVSAEAVAPMCHRHIVSAQGEAALHDFDLTKKVGKKIKLQKYRRAVVLCVVDMADFDGSLPREALQELLPDLEEGQYESPATLGYRLVIAASKVDLLPPQASPARLQVESQPLSCWGLHLPTCEAHLSKPCALLLPHRSL